MFADYRCCCGKPGGRRFKQAGRLPAECVVLDCLDVRENRWVLNSVTRRSVEPGAPTGRGSPLHTGRSQHLLGTAQGLKIPGSAAHMVSRSLADIPSRPPQCQLNWIVRVIFRQIPTTNLFYVIQYPLTPAWETCSAGWENLLTTALYWQIEFKFVAK